MNKKKDLAVNKNFTLALQNHKKNNFQIAEKLYNEILKSSPFHEGAQSNLGILYNQLGKPQKAINCFEKAIQINPNSANAYYSLGVIFAQLGESQKAISYYEKAIQINPNSANAYYSLGVIFAQLGESQKAISCYEKAIQINPYYIDAHNNLGVIFTQLGESQKAINCFEKAIKIKPENLTSHWLSMNTFPVIYKNFEEIEQYRNNFKKSINKVNLLLDAQSKYSKKQLISALNSSTNFYLHYQGTDVLDLQKRYANLIEKITQNIYQEFHKERKKNISSKYIKVGFVSCFFKNHTVSKLFKNWILKLDQKYFKRFVYYAGNEFDHTTNEIKQNVDYFFNHTDVDQLINQIFKDNLDVLIYLDIGMKPIIQILSSLRLAPIQCNTWGHPVTSGFKNIDYYFSSELMEDKNSQKNYSENLIILPNLGINYDFPNLSNIKKPNILNKSNSTIYLNLQSLFKLIPQDDHIYLDILKKNSNCCFWFIQGNNNSVTSIFKERISKLFKKEGYNFEKYSYFHPRCKQEEFFGLIEESDIILDSFNWSGGNTSLEAISLNKPIVTYPSNYMRGRHTYGILKILDIDETIATSKKNYVEIAVKLANEKKFRNSIIDKMKKNKNKLFNDDKSLKFLEEVIRKKLI